MNNRTKKELLSVWNGKIAILAGLSVVLPLVIYAMYKVGYFDVFTGESWEDLKYLVCGPLFIIVGIALAPVWIVLPFYLAYLYMKFMITAITMIYRRINMGKDKERTPWTREELLECLRLENEALKNKSDG